MYTADYIIQRRKDKWNDDRNAARDKEMREAIAHEVLTNDSLRSEIQKYPEKLIELCFIIVDKDKNTVPFFLNEVQKDFVKTLNKTKEDYANGKITDISLLVLKGRQQGFTSFITAYQLASILVNRNFEGYTVADETSNAESIFESKAKYPYSQLPDVLKPTEKYNNKRELRFEKLNSTWGVDTATKQMGRSRTINFLHASECAFWPYGIAITQASLGEALTKSCIKIYESTANGFNDYRDMWVSENHINCFYEWWRTEEYSIEFESQEIKKEFIEKIDIKTDWIFSRCKTLRDVNKLRYEQIYWYYKKYLNYLDKELIKQEYPCSPEESFISSGTPCFNNELIIQRIETLRKQERTIRKGSFFVEYMSETKDRIKSWEFKDKINNYIEIYEEPKQNAFYVIGGDTKGEGSDNYACTVIDNNTGQRVARIWGDIAHNVFVEQIYALGMYYNTALINIEVNFNMYPIEELKRLNYPKQYVRKQYDSYLGKHKETYGWKTDGNTRDLIISKQQVLIQNNIDLFNDIDMLMECLTFVKDKNGRYDAMVGKHDDLLFSDMIAEAGREQQQVYIEVIDKKIKRENTFDLEENESIYDTEITQSFLDY